jgi:hypothetical protein
MKFSVRLTTSIILLVLSALTVQSQTVALYGWRCRGLPKTKILLATLTTTTSYHFIDAL